MIYSQTIIKGDKNASVCTFKIKRENFNSLFFNIVTFCFCTFKKGSGTLYSGKNNLNVCCKNVPGKSMSLVLLHFMQKSY